VQRSAKIRLPEIRSAIRRVALKLKNGTRRFSKNGEFSAEPLRKGREVQHSKDRVARLSMRKLKVEHFTRGDAMPGSRKRYAGRRKVPEVETSSWDER
jgi:hypothetical protein